VQASTEEQCFYNNKEKQKIYQEKISSKNKKISIPSENIFQTKVSKIFKNIQRRKGFIINTCTTINAKVTTKIMQENYS
jgi:hypothetical protein